jgi:hypothetical protein
MKIFKKAIFFLFIFTFDSFSLSTTAMLCNISAKSAMISSFSMTVY